MNDSQLKALVDEELEWEPSLEADDIGVAIEDGVVTLMGHVKNYAQKHAAEDAAKRVKGVRAIVEKLEVRFGNAPKTADDEIARRAIKLLDWDVSIPKGDIFATVQNGFVTLTGSVEWNYQRAKAAKLVGGLNGVTGVFNDIKVKNRVSKSNIKQRIEDALTRNAEIEAKGIMVSISEGKVTLDGKVDHWHDRKIAENAAWAAPGVTSVVDNLIIE
jgi:osmotically-inducible protein OsmY